MKLITRNIIWESARNRLIFRLALLLLTSLATVAAVLYPIALRPSNFQLNVGDVAPQDIQAPRSLTYVSEVLTRDARENAANQVAPVYLSADPAITRRQIENMRTAFGYITNVRGDAYATNEQKIEDLGALRDITLDRETRIEILSLSDSRWDTVQQESLAVLEQAMRSTIREDQVEDAKARIPQLISFSLPEDLAGIVADLVSPYVVANSLYSPELTEQARQQARESITPVTRTLITGESIVRRGQVISEVAWETLSEFGLIQSTSQQQDIWAGIALVVAIDVFVVMYFNRRRNERPYDDPRGLLLLAIVFVVYLVAAKLLVSNHTVTPYIFPVAAFGMTFATLFHIELGMVFSFLLAVLIAYGEPNALDLSIFYTLTSCVGVVVLGRGRRIGRFITAGLFIGLVGTAIVVAYRLPDSITDWIGIATLTGASFINGLAAASITLLFQYLFSQLLGIATPLQLLEISRPDHPLMQFILKNAPGTYQHSLQVANLAEQAAEAIGADALLTRVGTIYHDAGKAVNPAFFIENQVSGVLNAHDDLDPKESAATIIRHVQDGVNLARKHRLPPRLLDFMREHHGTLLTRYQYAQAVKAAGNDPTAVNESDFRYPGPRPQSRETAILMLADGVEARARAELPQDEEALSALVHKVIDFCLSEGQLDDTTLTMRDLTTIAESFISTLRNTYHPRIKYPELKPAEKVQKETQVPVNVSAETEAE